MIKKLLYCSNGGRSVPLSLPDGSSGSSGVSVSSVVAASPTNHTHAETNELPLLLALGFVAVGVGSGSKSRTAHLVLLRQFSLVAVYNVLRDAALYGFRSNILATEPAAVVAVGGADIYR